MHYCDLVYLRAGLLSRRSAKPAAVMHRLSDRKIFAPRVPDCRRGSQKFFSSGPNFRPDRALIGRSTVWFRKFGAC